PTTPPKPSADNKEQETSPPPRASAYATAPTEMAPMAQPPAANEHNRAPRPLAPGAPSHRAGRAPPRQAPPRGDRTADTAPAPPPTLITSRAVASSRTATSTVTSSGPPANIPSCATASRA